MQTQKVDLHTINNGAACALFEADGGAWRLTALKSIKKYLADNIADLTVIA